MRVNFKPLIKFCGTRTHSAAETKSIGLQAGARVVIDCPDLWSGVFAMSPKQPYRDMTNSARLSGPSHLDNFILTPNARQLIGTLQRHMPTLTPRLRRGRLPATH